MELILHVGMPKTGSSAIQRMLQLRRDELAGRGILYPLNGRHHQLAWGIYGSHGVNDLRAWNKLQAEANASGLPRMVVSSESFGQMGEERLELLRKLTEPYDTRILLYLRNAFGYMQSEYRQYVKAKGLRAPFEQFVGSTIQRINYPSIICRWNSVGKVEACAYDAVRSTLVADFLTRVGADTDLATQDLVNKTPDDRTINALLLLNRLNLHPRIDAPLRRSLSSGLRPLKRLFPDSIAEGNARNVVAEAVEGWDSKFMRQYFSQPDLDLLMK